MKYSPLLRPKNLTSKLRGFLLVETLVVMTILVFITLLVVPRLSYFQRFIIASELEIITMAIVTAQITAQATLSEQSIKFDPEHNRYEHHEFIHSLPGCLRFGVIPGIKGPPSKPTKDIACAISFPQNKIQCSPKGITTAGTLYLTDGNQLYALTVSIGTLPYIRTYRYETEWVRLA